MAVRYARSTDGNDADTGATWALAKATVAAAVTSAAAAGTCWVSQNHAESTAAAVTITVSAPGSLSSIVKLLCGNDAAEPPTALATTGSISTTGANDINLNMSNSYTYGLTFNAGSAANTAKITIAGYSSASREGVAVFDNCTFKLNNSSASSLIDISLVVSSNQYGVVKFKDCTFIFGATGQKITFSGPVEFINCTFAATGTVPTTLFSANADNMCKLRAIGCNIAAVTGTLLAMGSNNQVSGDFIDCSLGSGITPASSNLDTTNSGMRLYNCDSGATNYRYYNYGQKATAQHDTATYVNDGTGANDGTNTISTKVVTGTRTQIYDAWESEPISIWNEDTGSSKTATIEIAGASQLTNADIWMEVEYLGSSSKPVASKVSSRVSSIITAGSNYSASSATWAGAPAQKQVMSVTFTPQMKGDIIARVYVAKTSYTAYFNPALNVA